MRRVGPLFVENVERLVSVVQVLAETKVNQVEDATESNIAMGEGLKSHVSTRRDEKTGRTRLRGYSYDYEMPKMDRF